MDQGPARPHVMTPARRRLAAIAALASFALLVVVTIVFLLNNAGALVLGLVGLGLAAAGAWWIVTEQNPRRTIGVVGVVLGMVVVGTSVGFVFTTVDGIGLRVVVVAVLLGLGIGSARAALVRDLHAAATITVTAAARPRHAVLICNPWSGGGKVERFGIAELAREKGVEVVMLDHGLDLEQLARDAVARGADCLAMAGGDGSQALVASIAIEHDLPFVVVSAGTRNHFALDLGLDREDPRESLDAFDDGVERRVDYATMGDRLFVNNVSLGVYATIVQSDEYRDAKVDTTKTLLPELIGRRAEPFDLQFTNPDDREVDGAFLIQVSNNPYVIGASLDTAQRRRLDTGQLGVVGVSTRTGAEAASLLTLSAVGQRSKSPHWHEFTADAFEVRSRSGSIAAGVDGEALTVATPIEFRIHPRGLRLLFPRRDLESAERRRARDVDVRRLVDLALGRSDEDPLDG